MWEMTQIGAGPVRTGRVTVTVAVWPGWVTVNLSGPVWATVALLAQPAAHAFTTDDGRSSQG
jgi:hypothetical protein